MFTSLTVKEVITVLLMCLDAADYNISREQCAAAVNAARDNKVTAPYVAMFEEEA